MRFSLHLDGDIADLPELLDALSGLNLEAEGDLAALPGTAGNAAAPKERKARAAKPAPAPAEPAATAQAEGQVDPFAAAPTAQASTAPATTQAEASPGSASGQTAQATASPSDGAITYDMLKDTMTEVLKAKSAAAAQGIVKEASGGKPSLSQCSPDQYPAVYAALKAALAA